MQLGRPHKPCFEAGTLDQRDLTLVGIYSTRKLEVVRVLMDAVKHTPTTALLVAKRPHFEPH
jgi:hypothetical protein